MPFYFDTTEQIKAGDRVQWGKSFGKIVFVLDDDQYLPGWPKANWEYLKKDKNGSGVMILLDDGTLILEDPNCEDIELKNRM